MLKKITNRTLCPQIYYDKAFDSHELQPGKSKVIDVVGYEESENIISRPPKGGCKVTNIFVDPSTDRVEIQYNDKT